MPNLPKPQTSRSISADVPDSEEFNPTRLTLARKRRGLTKAELAEKIGVDPRAITAFESGEYPPSEDTLRSISGVLTFPLTFFFGPTIEEPCIETASFRALTKMTASQRDRALSGGTLALCFNKFIEARFELPKADLPDLGKETSPESAAVSLRRYWGIGELTVRNMVHLLEAKGIRVFSLAIDAREVDAYSFWDNGTPFVFLNTYKTAEHSRYDAAHELGHLVLHRHGGPKGREAEIEVNSFASAFLMPRGDIIANAPRFPSFWDLAKAKKRWKTSVAALAYRMHAVGMLSDWQYRTLCIEIVKYGRDREPEECPRETSLVLPAVFSALYEDGVTRSDVARELRITTSELEQMMFGLTMTSVEGGRQTSNTKKGEPRLRLVQKG